ncbi:unnamed protein product [Cylindrotheca closterium]|uniref:Uncharacterized protein n=1 Tax=Cylindrotheca closterium TaxID=2856 RepID=A0AAD2PU45_9STRA|nr:unnamed protein product [Cylindrotheca closterium]
MRQSKRRKKVANEMEIGDGSEDDDHGVGNDELHYDDDDDVDVEDASSMHDEPSEEQRNDENTTERSNDESGHESNFLDISFFKLPCLQQAKLESPQSPFYVLAGSFIALKHTLLKPRWFQLFYRETEESKAYEDIRIFHELLGLSQKECLDVLVASGLVGPNKNCQMKAKKAIFEVSWKVALILK